MATGRAEDDEDAEEDGSAEAGQGNAKSSGEDRRGPPEHAGGPK